MRLLLVQAWISAGQPRVDTPAFGGFEQWVDVVGSILAFHGIHELLSNREECSEAMDDDQESWAAFMAYWAASGTPERTVPQFVGPLVLTGGRFRVQQRAARAGLSGRAPLRRVGKKIAHGAHRPMCGKALGKKHYPVVSA
ncbi:MAG TPA: hypothetical protein VGO16_08150 [Pseudonocardiaceae bacterium]|nr:hypothetical protein [Pseudonocardiaceae bacterium]